MFEYTLHLPVRERSALREPEEHVINFDRKREAKQEFKDDLATQMTAATEQKRRGRKRERDDLYFIKA